MSRSSLVRIALGFTLVVLPSAARAELRVMATVPDLAAITQAVGGPFVSVKAMALPTQDPHFVDAKPSLALDLNHANLLVVVGLGLEVGWLPPLLLGARNADVRPGGRGHLDCSQFVKLLDVATQPVDRSMGDIHPGGNPHFLSDPRAGAEVARGIAARLAELDPTHAAAFRANLQALLDRLSAFRQTWEKRLGPHRGAPIITYHRTLTYVADWLGLVEAGFLEPKPGIPPNPPHIAHLLTLARERKVRVILQEEYYPDAIARLMADKIPASLIRVEGATNFPRGESYLQHLERLATAIEKGLHT